PSLRTRNNSKPSASSVSPPDMENAPGLSRSNPRTARRPTLSALLTTASAILRAPASLKMRLSMKAYVTVMLKTTVLDPQGKTIHGALKKMGYKGVGDVRQGKFFEIALNGGLDKAAAKAEVERIAKEVLTNPVIEEFSYRIEE